MPKRAPGQVERLQQVFEILGKPARTKTCEAMQGLTSEMEEDLGDFDGSPAADAVLIASAQAIEHYEIARYGTLKTWAGQLGHDDAVKLLDQTLQEEKKADELLTQLAAERQQRGRVGRRRGRRRGSSWTPPPPRAAAAVPRPRPSNSDDSQSFPRKRGPGGSARRVPACRLQSLRQQARP